MEFSLPTAILGALTGSLILVAALWLSWRLPDAPEGLGWWAMAFCINAARQAIYLLAGVIGREQAIFLGESAQALMSICLLVGTLRFVDRRLSHVGLVALCVLAVAWAAITTYAVPNFLLQTVPLYVLGGSVMIGSGIILMRSRVLSSDKAPMITGVLLILWGLHKLDFPFLRPVEWFAPIGFLLAQALSIATAVGLIVLAMRALQDKAESTGLELKQSHDSQDIINQLLRISLEESNLNRMLDKAIDLITATPWLPLLPRGGIFLTEGNPPRLRLTANKALEPVLVKMCTQVAFGECLCGRAAATKEIQHAHCVDDRHEHRYEGMRPHGHYNVPIVARGRVLGVIVLYLEDGHQRDERETGFLTAVADTLAIVIERRRAEEQLRQAQKMETVGQLTGGVAHDFNNLLAVIIGNLELVKERIETDDKVRQLVEDALGAADRGADLTDRLLSLSRKRTLRPRVLDVNRHIEEMISLLGRTLGENYEIETEFGPNGIRCRVDAAQLENAILNLALNARDAMAGAGRLTIRTSVRHLHRTGAEPGAQIEPGDYTVIEVADTGSGMAPEIAEQAFEPFFTTKPIGLGSGLGLSMVQRFVRQSGGIATIDSRVDDGTTVRLWLPATKDEVESDATTVASPVAAGKGETVLVTEDDAAVRALAATMLTDLGYRVVEAGDADSAISELSDLPEARLILTDVVLPGGVSGLELARRALEVRPDIGVLYMSGYSENAVAQRGELEARDNLLQKPFRKTELAQKVRRVLAEGAHQPAI